MYYRHCLVYPSLLETHSPVHYQLRLPNLARSLPNSSRVNLPSLTLVYHSRTKRIRHRFLTILPTQCCEPSQGIVPQSATNSTRWDFRKPPRIRSIDPEIGFGLAPKHPHSYTHESPLELFVPSFPLSCYSSLPSLFSFTTNFLFSPRYISLFLNRSWNGR